MTIDHKKFARPFEEGPNPPNGLFKYDDIKKMIRDDIPKCSGCDGSERFAMEHKGKWFVICLQCHTVTATDWKPDKGKG
jgi:hypothetical protein